MRYSVIIVICLAACMLAGSASADTRIAVSGDSLEDTADLPVVISGITAATGVSFELSYDKDVLLIENITASNDTPGSNVLSRIDNDVGYAKVVITNTQGISAPEPVSLVVIRVTRVGSGEGTLSILNPQWSDAQFMPFDFDVVLNGSIGSSQTATPAATVTSSSGSEGSSSSSSGVPAATLTVESTVAPAVTTAVPGATTPLPPVSPDDTTVTSPAASPGMIAESADSPVTPKATPGFCTATVLTAGTLGAALMLRRRA